MAITASIAALLLPAATNHAATATAPSEPQRVVLISIDGARAGLADWPQVTPRLSGLSRTGRRLARATTPATPTFAATAALLTGRSPASSGVRDEAHNTISRGSSTLAASFAGHGYATAALPGDRLCHARSGISQGFETFVLGAPTLSDSARVDSALALATRPGRQFVWLGLSFGQPSHIWRRPSGCGLPDSTAYAARATAIDQQLGRFVDGLRDAGVLDSTLLVVAGTHGESIAGWPLAAGDFAEEALPGRGLDLADDTLRVPLVLHGPGLGSPELLSPQPWVSTLDIAPTLLMAAGVDAAPELDGVSLWPLLEGGSLVARVLVHETDVVRGLGWRPRVTARCGPRKLIGYGEERRQLAAGGWAPPAPGSCNWAELEAAVAARLASLSEPSGTGSVEGDVGPGVADEHRCYVALQEVLATAPRPAAELEADIAKLFAECPANPLLRVEASLFTSLGGEDERAAADLVTLLQATPDFPEAAIAYMDHLLRYRRFDLVAEAFDHLAAGPLLHLHGLWRVVNAQTALLDLGVATSTLDYAEAIGPPPGPHWERSAAICRRVIRTKRFVDEEPDRAALRLEYAKALGDFGLYEKCYHELHRARYLQRLDPQPEPDYLIATYLLVEGKPSKAGATLQRALEIDPDYVPALLALADAKVQIGEQAEALGYLQRAIELDDTDPVSHYNLACLLALANHLDEAAAELERAIGLGYSNWQQIKTDDDLVLLRSTPAYQRLLEQEPSAGAQ